MNVQKFRPKFLRGSSLRLHEVFIFSIILSFILINSSLNIINFKNTTDLLTSALKANSKLIGVLYKIDNSYTRLMLNLQDLVISVDREKLSALYIELSNVKNFNQQVTYYSEHNLILGPRDEESTKKLNDLLAEVDTSIDTSIDIIINDLFENRQSNAKTNFIELRDNELQYIQSEISSLIRRQEYIINKIVLTVNKQRSQVWIIMLFQNFIIALVCILLVFYFDRRITKPLMILTRKFGEINSGSLDADLEFMRNDTVQEVDLLVKAADTMRNRLSKSFDAIQSHNDELEQRIQERTNEIYSRNQTLKEALDELQRTQVKLLNAEKQSFITYLVHNLLHRINTPLGNAIMGIDLVRLHVNECKKTIALEDFLDIEATLELIVNSQHRIKHTMDNLNAMLEIDRNESTSLVNPRKVIEYTFSKVQLNHLNDWKLKITYKVLGDKEGHLVEDYGLTCELLLQKMNFTMMIESLFEFLLHSKTGDMLSKTTSIELVHSINALDIIVVDETFVKGALQFDSLEAYVYSLAKEENISLDLAFVIQSASTGMDGYVEFIDHVHDHDLYHNALHINIPLQKEV